MSRVSNGDLDRFVTIRSARAGEAFRGVALAPGKEDGRQKPTTEFAATGGWELTSSPRQEGSTINLLMTSHNLDPSPVSEICENVKNLGYICSARVRLYGEDF